MKPRPNIVVLDGAVLNPGDNPWDEIAALGSLTVHDRTPPELTLERGQDAEVIFTNKTRLTAEILAGLPRLGFIGVLATGYDVVDLAGAGSRGIPVSNVPGYGTESVAQFVMAQLLTLCRQPGLHDRLVREGEWTRSGEYSFWTTPQVELAGLTMGVVGFGSIGRRVGELALALGMGVLAHCPRPKEPLAGRFSFAPLRELFAQADVISLHCPLTSDNQAFVNRDLLGLMKPGGFFLNTARGGLVNEADLAEALNAGNLAGAALDVLTVEPPVPDHPLLSAKNCLLTPHMAWASLTARKRLTAMAADNLRGFLAGAPKNVVNAGYLKTA
jgi:glycerate dehydrogenase